MAKKAGVDSGAELVASYRRSRQTRKQFCAEAGVAVTTLDYYLRRENARARSRAGLVAVEVRREVAPLVLQFPNGLRLEIDIGFDEGLLRRLVAVLV